MIARIIAKDYKAFGAKIVEWALHPDSRPKSLDELKASVHHILEIPDRIKDIQFLESDLTTFIIKLPAKELVHDSLKRFADEHEKYHVPHFYYDKVCDGGKGMPNLEFLYSRIADYTIAQCM